MSESSLYPTAIDSSNIYEVVARLSTTLTADITAATTTIPLASTTGFPTQGYIVIDNETIAYISVSVSSVDATGGRGHAGTAASHLNTTQVLVAVTAAVFNKLRAGLIAVQTALGANLVNIVNNGGWKTVTDTWTYNAANKINVPSGAALIYQKGDKIKFTQDYITTKYFYIIGVADTLLTVTAGSAFTVINTGIDLIYYSHQENPIGFPQFFAYTPTGPTNTTLTGRFKIHGNLVTCGILGAITGTPVWTNNPTLPVTASANLFGGAGFVTGIGGYLDAGTAQVGNSVYPYISANGTVLKMVTASNSTAFAATVPITWANGDNWYFWFTYEI